MTMSNSWSYVPNDVYKPTNEIIEKLVDIVSKGGNYLLNIGPSPDGTFDDSAYSRLKEIGKWMKVNGEAIYGTRMADTYGEGNVRYTAAKDGKTKYVFFFDKPGAKVSFNKVSVDKKTKITAVGTKTALKWKQVDGGVEVAIPAAVSNAGEHVWVLKVVNP
jgi:alpha-L-fucosidase